MKQIWGRNEETPAKPGNDHDVTSKSKKDSITIQNEPSFIEVVENKIYFFAEIERDKVLQLIRNIRELNDSFIVRKQKYNQEGFPPLYVFINSYGGSIFAGLSVMDEIINSTVPITTVVDGCCASAATLFSVAGRRRMMKKHSYMLIHQLSSCFWGKHSEFKDEMENLDRLMRMIKEIYKEYTTIPMKKLEEILSHDLWLDSKACLEYGLVDEIIH